jgi:hypothetical protein
LTGVVWLRIDRGAASEMGAWKDMRFTLVAALALSSTFGGISGMSWVGSAGGGRLGRKTAEKCEKILGKIFLLGSGIAEKSMTSSEAVKSMMSGNEAALGGSGFGALAGMFKFLKEESCNFFCKKSSSSYCCEMDLWVTGITRNDVVPLLLTVGEMSSVSSVSSESSEYEKECKTSNTLNYR